MKSKHLLVLTIILSLFSYSCSKSTIGPSDCGLLFTIQYIDINTGKDIGTEGVAFLDSLKITNFTNWGDGFSNIGEDVYVNKTFDKGKTFFSFLSPSFDLCNNNIYLAPKVDKYNISYSGLMQSDSIIFFIYNDNDLNTITYSFNDSLIGTLLRKDLKSSVTDLPTIQIKK